MKEIIIIAAIAKNNVIGCKGKLPWHIPEDLRRFRKKTIGYTVVMGRKTFESLPVKPLPGRENIIVTRNINYKADSSILADTNSIITNSIEEAIDKASNGKVFIIGGAEIYRQSLKLATILDFTMLKQKFEGDVVFPEIKWKNWQLLSEEEHGEYSYKTFRRKKGNHNQ